MSFYDEEGNYDGGKHYEAQRQATEAGRYHAERGSYSYDIGRGDYDLRYAYDQAHKHESWRIASERHQARDDSFDLTTDDNKPRYSAGFSVRGYLFDMVLDPRLLLLTLLVVCFGLYVVVASTVSSVSNYLTPKYPDRLFFITTIARQDNPRDVFVGPESLVENFQNLYYKDPEGLIIQLRVDMNNWEKNSSAFNTRQSSLIDAVEQCINKKMSFKSCIVGTNPGLGVTNISPHISYLKDDPLLAPR